MLEAFLAPEEGLALVPRLVPSTLAAAARMQIRAALDQTDWRIRGPVGASPSDWSERLRDVGGRPAVLRRCECRRRPSNPVFSKGESACRPRSGRVE